VLVSGLSGAGKSSILRTLEDLGYDAVDNPPLRLLEELVARGGARLAVGVDARGRDFDAVEVLEVLIRLRAGVRVDLIYAHADETVLLRRYTETRRRHPLAPLGRVADGIAAERDLVAPLREQADLVVDTTELPLPALRRLIEQQFTDDVQAVSPTISLLSFAFPAGLPRDADMVFDARFLRNPHYDQQLRPLTGLDHRVAVHVEADPDFADFFNKMTDLLALVLPRFVQEGKKYATIAIGCTGGRHRSVHIVERLAAHLAQLGWRVTVTHRELSRGSASVAGPAAAAVVQAQEA
jgi:UPF0042 nucleotide-binding protein